MQFKNITLQLLSKLGRHLPRRLVQRDPMPEGNVAVKSAEIPVSLARSCLKYAAASEDDLYQEFSSHPEGLNAREAEKAREKFGLNQIPAQKPAPWFVHLWLCYRNPFNLLLTVLGIFSYAAEDDLFGAGVIALMVVISTLLNFIQERRSTQAADALKAMVGNTATVLRVVSDYGDYQFIEVPLSKLVPGDIVKLAAGDMIPADLRLIKARDLFVAQASLTGESVTERIRFSISSFSGTMSSPRRT